MIRPVRSILAFLFVGAAVFGIVRFGFWWDGVFTQRTPLYWALSKVVAWGLGIFFGGFAAYTAWKSS